MLGLLKKLDEALKRSARDISERDYNYQSYHPADDESWSDFLARMVKEGRLTKREAREALESATVNHRDTDEILPYYES